MQHQKHLNLTVEEMLKHFPYESPREIQLEALKNIAANLRSEHELPTGVGKTILGLIWLLALQARGMKNLVYSTLNKSLVAQVAEEAANCGLQNKVVVVYGRNEYNCLYYEKNDEKIITAEDSPCSLLKECPHRVDLETGQTTEPGVSPCPYLQAKFLARQGRIIICTHAFLITNLLYNKGFDTPQGLVLDEAQELARVTRSVFSHTISDANLKRAIEALSKIEQQNDLEEFLKVMYKIARLKPVNKQPILKNNEIQYLINALKEINKRKIEKSLKKAIDRGILDTEKDIAILKTIEKIVRHIPWYISNLYYSISVEGRKAENYAYYYFDKNNNLCILNIRHFYVSPLIRKLLKNIPWVLALSAYIIDPKTFDIENGIKFPFYAYQSDFPVNNTGIFLPTDTANLAIKSASRNDKPETMEMIATTCKAFLQEGHRSLIVVGSNAEKDYFTEKFSGKLDIISYGNGIKPREAVTKFKSGQGDVLLGTAANFATGIDLPRRIAEVIMALRPTYPHPDDPQTQFEEERFGPFRWTLWNWRATIEALQLRGRNIRSIEDLGICIFWSQQYNRVLARLPAYLEEAKIKKTLKECKEEGLRILKHK